MMRRSASVPTSPLWTCCVPGVIGCFGSVRTGSCWSARVCVVWSSILRGARCRGPGSSGVGTASDWFRICSGRSLPGWVAKGVGGVGVRVGPCVRVAAAGSATAGVRACRPGRCGRQAGPDLPKVVRCSGSHQSTLIRVATCARGSDAATAELFHWWNPDASMRNLCSSDERGLRSCPQQSLPQWGGTTCGSWPRL